MIVITKRSMEVIVTINIEVDMDIIEIIEKEGYLAHIVPSTRLLTDKNGKVFLKTY